MQRHFLPALALFMALFSHSASAQTAPATPAAGGQAFTTQAVAVDPATLSGANNTTIILWGITPAVKIDTVEGIRARVYLDDMMGGRAIRCMPMTGTFAAGATLQARCVTSDDRDLGLQMLGAGIATVDRMDITGSDLAQQYLGAERQARIGRRGIWDMKNAASPTPTANAITPAMLGGLPLWVLAWGALAIPFAGFLALALIMHLGLRKLITLQRYQLAGTQKRERQLKEREKYVIASALESEVMTNRAKLDAFLTIYEEMLKSLRDPSKTPKYQRAGDIVHEKPALTRTVFDAHVDKLDLLGPQLSSELAALYNMVVPNPDYKMLEPEVPIAKAQELVDRIVRNAEKLLEPMDKVAGALAVIVRDKRGAVTAPE